MSREDQRLRFGALPQHTCKRFQVWYAGSPARNHITEHRSRAVLNAVPVRIDKLRVLEVGAGWGFFSFLAARQGAEAVATDLLIEDVVCGSQVAKLNQYGNGIRFCAADALHLPFPDEFFDVSVSMEMIEHMEGGAVKVCEEMQRVTKSGGFVVISTPNPHGLAQMVKTLLKRSAWLRHRYDFLDYDEWFLTKRQVTSAGAAVGLELVEFHRTGLTVPFLPSWLLNLNLLVEKTFQLFPFFLTTNILVFRKRRSFCD